METLTVSVHHDPATKRVTIVIPTIDADGMRPYFPPEIILPGEYFENFSYDDLVAHGDGPLKIPIEAASDSAPHRSSAGRLPLAALSSNHDSR